MENIVNKKFINLISIVGLSLTIGLSIYFYHLGVFSDVNSLRHLVGQTVVLGPLLFIIIQIVQVIVPIIPGGISLAAGVIIFGPAAGFIYNYVGICIGSILLFLLGRHYGRPFIIKLVGDKLYNKYSGWLDNQSRFEKLFALAIFLPVAPDDTLCVMASLTKISVKKFSLIILLCKPASIALYSFALVYGGHFLTQLLH